MGGRSATAPVAAYDRGVSVGVATDEQTVAEPEAGPGGGTLPGISESIRRRLTAVPFGDWRTWAATGWVVAIAAILRFVNLGLPPGLVFDEVYYATEGAELLDHGVEWRTETDSAGNVLGSRRRLRGASAARKVDHRAGHQ